MIGLGPCSYEENSVSPMPRALVKWIPDGAKTRFRDVVFRVAAARARREIRRSPLGIPGPSTLRALWFGWGNTGWSADTEYLAAIAKGAITAPVVLECGSGLSTVLLALLAERHPIRVSSLEHDSAWRVRVKARLKTLGLDAPGLASSPLRNYDGYAWYTPPATDTELFRLVVCDGPPGDTPGGRYGLLPVMRDRLADDAVVFLDDVAREGERSILDRWQNEFGVSYATAGSRDQFARVRLAGVGDMGINTPNRL